MTELAITRSFPIVPQVTSLIDGKHVAPRATGEEIEIVNPATEAVLTRLREADAEEVDTAVDRKSTRLNSSHVSESRMPSSA